MGNIVGLPSPRSDWNQTDETKADYIKNKPDIEALNKKIGDINAALDTIIAQQETILAVQNAYIGGDSV